MSIVTLMLPGQPQELNKENQRNSGIMQQFWSNFKMILQLLLNNKSFSTIDFLLLWGTVMMLFLYVFGSFMPCWSVQRSDWSCGRETEPCGRDIVPFQLLQDNCKPQTLWSWWYWSKPVHRCHCSCFSRESWHVSYTVCLKKQTPSRDCSLSGSLHSVVPNTTWAGSLVSCKAWAR